MISDTVSCDILCDIVHQFLFCRCHSVIPPKLRDHNSIVLSLVLVYMPYDMNIVLNFFTSCCIYYHVCTLCQFFTVRTLVMYRQVYVWGYAPLPAIMSTLRSLTPFRKWTVVKHSAHAHVCSLRLNTVKLNARHHGTTLHKSF